MAFPGLLLPAKHRGVYTHRRGKRPMSSKTSAKIWVGILFCVGCVLAAGSLAQSTVWARPASAEDEVLAAEQARADALTHNDYNALDKILGDDLMYCHSGGRVDDKKGFMAPLLSGDNHYIRMEKKTARVHVVGKVAIIYGNFLVQTQGKAGTPPRELEDAILTLVYEKR